MQRRGISQVVTTLLFVLIALGAVLLVWNLVRGIITQSSEDIDVTQFNLKYSLEGKNLYVNEELGSVSFVVKRDAGGGEAEVKSINVVLEDSTGNSAVYIPEEDIVIGELESRRIDINYKSLGLVDVVKVGVAPVLVANDGSDKLGNVLAEYNVGEDRVGHYLSFSGGGNYVEVPASSSLSGIGATTISAWVNLRTTNEPYEEFILKKGNSDPDRIEINNYEYTTTGYYGIWTGGLYGKSIIKSNEWFHLAVSASVGGNVKIYINGVKKVDSLPSPDRMPLGDGALQIGSISLVQSFDGSLDDVRVYNGVLSDDEVKGLYNNGNGDLSGSVNKGLVARYKFDEGSGAIAKDSSGNGNDGTIIGNPEWI